MTDELSQISATARGAARSQDWAQVDACAREILRRDNTSAEGYFLTGLVLKASRKPAMAAQSFEQALVLDADRYDAAVELANQYSIARRNGDTAALLAKYEEALGNSPMYLDLAGTVYVDIGLPERAWPLYKKATELQPGVDLFQANLAACGVYLGKVEEAKEIYQALLQRFPGHRRNHYELSRLEKAKDSTHIEQMKQILRGSDSPPDENVFIYYAIGKELEDLGQWQESFEFYQKAGDAVVSVADYDVATDVQLMDTIMGVCSADWLADAADACSADDSAKTPIFIVGLPRTGTTLTERIVSSHSQVESIGETLFLQMVLRRESAVHSVENMNPAIVEAVARKDMGIIAKGYLDAVSYRLGEKPMFIDKLPFNFLFLGFIAKAYPRARIIHLGRNPIDACFSMYKQVFTWAYKFSYSLEGLGRYYVAYDRMRNHWRKLLGDRMIEVEYESLVANQEAETRILLDKLGLEFEQACLDFDQNTAPSTTASSVQVREKVHTDSVNRWTRFSKQLQPLKEHLESAGIKVE
jgi:tetratricopeptide (TPR) repeat protein|tara:strand:- start:28600 stop:30183 length:1584 start_codon:yes stop_codon:yes gene_type:complete